MQARLLHCRTIWSYFCLVFVLQVESTVRQLTREQRLLTTQGVVTPIDAILKAATGDTTRSPGHRGFFLLVTGSRRFSRRLKTVTGSKASRFKRYARDPFYFIHAMVTRTHAILRCGHGVTAKFRRTQIVSPVAAYGSDHPLPLLILVDSCPLVDPSSSR